MFQILYLECVLVTTRWWWLLKAKGHSLHQTCTDDTSMAWCAKNNPLETTHCASLVVPLGDSVQLHTDFKCYYRTALVYDVLFPRSRWFILVRKLLDSFSDPTCDFRLCKQKLTWLNTKALPQFLHVLPTVDPHYYRRKATIFLKVVRWKKI